MDPVCHTLVGASLAGTRLGDRSRGAGAALVIAANLPDVDVLAYAWGSDTALWFRRGWTHGVLAVAVLPLLLAAGVVLWGRLRRVEGLVPREIVFLSYLGIATHPILDWLNTYGMRWLMPFDGTWTYGDTLFIVDPWLWLLLGGAAFLRFSSSKRALAGWGLLAAAMSLTVLLLPIVPSAAKILWSAGVLATVVARTGAGPLDGQGGRRLIAGVLLLAVGYVGVMAILSRTAAARVERALDPVGGSDVYTGPTPGDPTRWDVLVLEDGAYRPGAFSFLGRAGGSRWPNGGGAPLRAATPSEGDRLLLAEYLVSVGADDPRVATALAAPCIRGMRTWTRFPFFVVTESEQGTVVHVLDARYTRNVTRGFGGAAVRLGPEGRVLGCLPPGG